MGIGSDGTYAYNYHPFSFWNLWFLEFELDYIGKVSELLVILEGGPWSFMGGLPALMSGFKIQGKHGEHLGLCFSFFSCPFIFLWLA